MLLSDKSKPQPLLRSNGIYRFDYPEAFVLLLAVALVTVHYDFSPASMALFVIVSLPGLMILVYNYSRKSSFWTSNIVVILLSTVIGSLQLCTVISLSLALLIGIRVIVSASENRIRLLTVSVVTIMIFYYVSVTLNGANMDCDEGFCLPLFYWPVLLRFCGSFGICITSMSIMLRQQTKLRAA